MALNHGLVAGGDLDGILGPSDLRLRAVAGVGQHAGGRDDGNVGP